MIQRLPENSKCDYYLNHTKRDPRPYTIRKIPRHNGIYEYKLDIRLWHDIGLNIDVVVGKFNFNLEALTDHGAIRLNAEGEYVFEIIKNNDGTFRLGRQNSVQLP